MNGTGVLASTGFDHAHTLVQYIGVVMMIAIGSLFIPMEHHRY